VTKDSAPWQKAQVVVMLSRTPRANLIYIVGRKHDAIERLWNVITQRTQWTDYLDGLLNSWSIEGDGIDVPTMNKNFFDMAADFPFKVCDITIPNSNSGYVYLLVSTVCSDRTYTGQTKNLAVRLVKHNSGYGSKGTAPPEYLPYAPAAYITNMNHMTENDRMTLEWRWKYLNKRSIHRGQASIEDRINNGRTVMDEYNSRAAEENQLKMVVCIARTTNVVLT
jgi:predicted GIY-YIG superfamily endonuclease